MLNLLSLNIANDAKEEKYKRLIAENRKLIELTNGLGSHVVAAAAPVEPKPKPKPTATVAASTSTSSYGFAASTSVPYNGKTYEYMLKNLNPFIETAEIKHYFSSKKF
jgi:hypothetical protein